VFIVLLLDFNLLSYSQFCCIPLVVAIISFISEILKHKLDRLQQLEKLVVEQNEIIEDYIRREAIDKECDIAERTTKQQTAIESTPEINKEYNEQNACTTTTTRAEVYAQVASQLRVNQFGDFFEDITMIE